MLHPIATNVRAPIPLAFRVRNVWIQGTYKCGRTLWYAITSDVKLQGSLKVRKLATLSECDSFW